MLSIFMSITMRVIRSVFLKQKKDVSNFFNINIESIIQFDNVQNLVDYLNNFVTYLEA